MLFLLYSLQNASDVLQAFKAGASFYTPEGEIFSSRDLDRIAASGYAGIVLNDSAWLPL